jgi:hypothetical protein
MRMLHRHSVVLAVLLAACGNNRFESYYTGDGPSFTGISQSSERGNVGGDTVELSGSGFGDDPNRITVIFGSTNARVLQASDSSLTVEVPRGPLEGGPVDVAIATPDGEARQPAAYTYDMAPGHGGDPFENSVAYVAVTNDFLSCLGGLGATLTDEWAGQGGIFAEDLSNPFPDEMAELLIDNLDYAICGSEFFGAPFTGQTGTDARAELLQFAYPRLHSVYTGERLGYGGSWDVSWDEWRVEKPSQEVISVDIEGAVEDLRESLGAVSIENRSVQQHLGNDTDFCLDKSALGTFEVYAEGMPTGRNLPNNDGVVPLRGDRYSSHPESCEAGEGISYDLGELRFCEVDEYDNRASRTWGADWPVGQSFFQGVDEETDELSPLVGSRVALNVPALSVSGFELELPPPFVPQGYEPGQRPGNFFMFTGPTGVDCPGGDDAPTGESVYGYLTWDPADLSMDDQPRASDLEYMRSWVRFTIHHLPLSWLGASPGAIKATITVPDSHELDSSGRSRIAIPAWVMLQFPSVDFGPEEALPATSAELAGTAYLALSAERVTEYVIDVGGGETMTFAYSTGDIGFTYFTTNWTNTLELGSCGDCSDTDGDGWVDADDPDCQTGTEEANQTFGLSTCNDGIDNDGDGDIDADDSDCRDGSDDEGDCTDGRDNDGDGWVDDEDPDCEDIGDESGFTELPCNDGEDNDTDGLIDRDDPDCDTIDADEDDNCSDGIDNDEDGWADDFDPDCPGDGTGGLEDNVDVYAGSCNDGLDNDGDGWVDREDPVCTTPDSEEDDGFGLTECNDGVDNDGNGDVDRADPNCEREGPAGVETPVLGGDCVNGVDDDGDGWVDADDPGCERDVTTSEGTASVDPFTEDGVPACYNGLDDDGAGDVDSADPDCITGYTRAEDPLRPGCTDGQDEDGDGWLDLADPDCALGTDELGLGPTACNDGADNDGDTLVDADDPDCDDALDMDEAG